MRTVWRLAASVLLAVVLAWCGLAKAEEAAGGTVVVWGWDDPQSALQKAFADSHPTLKLDYVRMDWLTIEQRLMQALDNGTGLPDVAQIEIGALPAVMQRAQKGGLENLYRWTGPYRNDILPYAFKMGGSGFRVYAIPYDAAPAVIFYRRDIFEQAGVSADDIVTWDDLVSAGQKILASSQGKVKLCATASELFFCRFLLNDGQGGLVDSKGRITLASRNKEALADLELARSAVDDGLVAGIDPWTDDWFGAMREGTVAVFVSGCWLGGGIEHYIAPGTSGKWGVMPLPQPDQAFTGGTWSCIPSGAANKEGAQEYIRWMNLSPVGSKLGFVLRTWKTVPVIGSAYDDPLFSQENAFFGGQKVDQVYLQAALGIPDSVALNANDREAMEVFRAELRKCLEDRTLAPADCLEQTTAELKGRGLGR